MKVPGSMGGQNDMLDAVMASREASAGDNYAERSMQGRRTANTMQQTLQGKDAVNEMKVRVREDEQSIEEEIDKALAKKKELDKAEAERIAKAQEEAAKSAPASGSQGDTVEISNAGLEAAKDVTVAVSPPESAAAPSPTVVQPSAEASPAAPQSARADIKI